MHRVETKRLALVVGVLVLATAGCHLEEEPSVNLEPSAAVRVVVALPRSLPVASVASVVASATAAGEDATEQQLSGEGTRWQGTVSRVRSGAGGTVRATVLDAQGATVAQAQVSEVALPRHRSGLVVLVPQAPSPGAPEGNAAPLIDAVVGSAPNVRPGAELALRAVAHDLSEGESLTYAWRATGGSFSSATTPEAVWTAPEGAGAVTLTLQVTDARGAAATLDFTVGVDGVGAQAVDAQAAFNRWPSLAELGARPSPEVGEGTPVALQAEAVDDDGDALTYAWTATCEGTFDDAAAARASFTPTELPEAACNNCRLALTVRDGFGGQREDAVELCVVRRQPPVIVTTSQSSPSARAADLVRLRATAEDPQGEPLTFTWTSSTGLLGPPSRTGGTGEVDWTALSCLPADVVPTVGLTVTNASGLSDTRTFTVEWADRRCGRFPPCSLALADAKVTLEADCTTESTVFIPDGHTFDGAEHVLTAVDPEGGRFQGAVLRNRGATAHVSRVKVTARDMAGVGRCDDGENALSGIRLEGASGSITDSEVEALFQPGGLGGCQEGTAIEVRNAVAAETVARVDVLRNRATGYQKTGITAAGRVDVRVEGNTLDGGGPVNSIARNGISMGSGATGRVTGNTVRGHSYSGADYVASGIVVSGGSHYGVPLSKDIVIRDNTLADNDVGINLSQLLAGGGPPSEPTRIQVVENRLSSAAVTNGIPYQAGVSDYGGANIISRNRIEGVGYDRATVPRSTFDVDVLAEDASQVAFLTPARRVAVGACSGALVVQSQDAGGNLSALAASALVVRSESSGVTFYADDACAEPLRASGAGSALTLRGAHQEAEFYFRATQAGAVTVLVTGEGVSAAQQEQTVE